MLDCAAAKLILHAAVLSRSHSIVDRMMLLVATCGITVPSDIL